MIIVRQYPLFLKNKRRSVESQVSESLLKTRVTCASIVSCGVSHHVVRDKANMAPSFKLL
jgi:hypothetical protein